MLFSRSTYSLLSILLVAVGAVVFIGCRKVPKFSETPNIQYKDIRKVTFFNADQLIDADSIILGIHFEDGDGDLGFPEDNRSEANLDYFVEVYRQTGGVFTPIVYEGVNYNGHLPLLAPVSTPGPIEGDIYYNMIFNYGDVIQQPLNDTLKFFVRIKDRKGNYSNTIESDPVIIRKTL